MRKTESLDKLFRMQKPLIFLRCAETRLDHLPSMLQRADLILAITAWQEPAV